MRNDILIAGETVIREGIANRITINRNCATGGYLILTNLRMIYIITKHKEIDCIIPFSEVAHKEADFDIYSDIPNIVKIRDKNGFLYEFSVRKGEKSLWESDIKKALVEYEQKHPLEESNLEEIVEEQEGADTLQEIIDVTETASDKSSEKIGSVAEEKAATSPLAIICVVIAPIAGIFFEYGFWLFLLIGIGFCYWDESILYHSGYDTLSLTKTYLIPVYLFKRARLLKRGMEYFVLWFFSFFIGIVFTFTSLSFWIKLLETLQTIITQG